MNEYSTSTHGGYNSTAVVLKAAELTESSVQRGMVYLDKANEVLSASIAQLEDRLTHGGVLKPEPPRAVESGRGNEVTPVSCELGAHLRAVGERLAAHEHRLSALLQRIDL